jgi:hypothetical protein
MDVTVELSDGATGDVVDQIHLELGRPLGQVDEPRQSLADISNSYSPA